MGKRVERGTLYDYVSNNYYIMTKEELKKIIHEALYRLGQCTTEEDYEQECEEIIDELDFLNGSEDD